MLLLWLNYRREQPEIQPWLSAEWQPAAFSWLSVFGWLCCVVDAIMVVHIRQDALARNYKKCPIAETRLFWDDCSRLNARWLELIGASASRSEGSLPIVVVVKIMIVPAAAPVSPSVHPCHLSFRQQKKQSKVDSPSRASKITHTVSSKPFAMFRITTLLFRLSPNPQRMGKV